MIVNTGFTDERDMRCGENERAHATRAAKAERREVSFWRFWLVFARVSDWWLTIYSIRLLAIRDAVLLLPIFAKKATFGLLDFNVLEQALFLRDFSSQEAD
jgi:hypothetical protein